MAKGTPALDYPPVRAYVGKLPGYPCDRCTKPYKDKSTSCNTDCPMWSAWFRQTWRDIQNKLKISTNEE